MLVASQTKRNGYPIADAGVMRVEQQAKGFVEILVLAGKTRHLIEAVKHGEMVLGDDRRLHHRRHHHGRDYGAAPTDQKKRSIDLSK
jgi:hypothetical protein